MGNFTRDKRILNSFNPKTDSFGPINLMALAGNEDDQSEARTGAIDCSQFINEGLEAVAARRPINSSAPAYTWLQDFRGGIGYLPGGHFRCDSPLELPNRTGMLGDVYSACAVVASDSYTDTNLIKTKDGSENVFGCTLRNIRVQANNQASITAVIRATSWQEHCAIEYCQIDGFQDDCDGILIDDVSGESAGWAIRDVQFGAFGSEGTGARSCIYIDGVTNAVPNAFQMTLERITCNASQDMQYGIYAGKGRTSMTNIHLEQCNDGIYLADGTHWIRNVTAGGSVVDVITIDASFPGRASVRFIDPNGATGNTWNDESNTTTDRTGFVRTQDIGAV